MATLPMSEKEKQDKDLQAPSEPVLGSPSGGGYATPTAQGGSPATSATPAAKPTSSGSYTNLMNYVGANNSSGGRMGQAVRSNVDTQANTAQQSLGAWKNTAESAVDQGTVKQNTAVQTNLQQDPTKVDAKEFQSQYNASYAGPQSADQVTGYADTQRGFTQVGDKVKAAGGDLAAKTGLVKDAYARPSYSRGEQRLDGFVLGTSEQGQQQLKGVQDAYGNFGSNFTQSVGDVNQKIQQGAQTSDATRQATRNAYDGSLDTSRRTINDANSRLTQQQQADEAAYKELMANLGGADANARNQAYGQLGVDETTAAYLQQHQMDPNRLITQGQKQALGDVVSDQTQGRYSALRGLLGNTSEFDFNKTGNAGGAYIADQRKLADIQALKAMMGDLNQRSAATNAKAKTDYDSAKARLGTSSKLSDSNTIAMITPKDFARAMGVSDEMYDQYALMNMNLSDYVREAGEAKLGDVASAEQDSVYQSILQSLGITNDSAMAKSNGRRSDTHLDMDALQAEYTRRLNDPNYSPLDNMNVDPNARRQGSSTYGTHQGGG